MGKSYDFKALGNNNFWFSSVVSLYSRLNCGFPNETMIKGPCYGDIIKVIQLINILTTRPFG